MRDELLHELDAAEASRTFRRRIVVANARVADHRYRMKDRVPRQSGIRIGAGIQQVRRQLEVRVHHRQEQRAGSRSRQGSAIPAPAGTIDRDALVHGRPGLLEHSNDADATFPHGKQQRREAGGQPGPEIRPGVDQLLHDGGVTFRRRPHEGRLPAPVIFTVNGRTAGQERPYRVERAGASGRHQRSLPARKGAVRVRSGLQEQLDHRAASIRAGQREWRHAIPAGSLHIGAGAHQQFRDLPIVVVCRPVQCRHPINLGCVHIDALCQERANLRPIHLLRRIRQRRAPP
jgi:hypothetical protein